MIKINEGYSMKNFLVLSAMLAILFGGCTAKEFNSGVDDIVNDVSNTFEEGRDKSAD